jgi:hypothetical protein
MDKFIIKTGKVRKVSVVMNECLKNIKLVPPQAGQ